MQKNEKARILVVDDHAIVREGMALFINLQEDLQLCGMASDVKEALTMTADCNPALVIVDISLKNESGLDLIKTLRRTYPNLALLVMSQHDEFIFAERSLTFGANGYLMKSEATNNIIGAIRKLLCGEIYLSDALHNRLLQSLTVSKFKKSELSLNLINNLSKREFEILHLIGLGFGSNQISKKLNRSIKTIEAHRASIKVKLQLKNGDELLRYAIQWMQDS